MRRLFLRDVAGIQGDLHHLFRPSMSIPLRHELLHVSRAIFLADSKMSNAENSRSDLRNDKTCQMSVCTTPPSRPPAIMAWTSSISSLATGACFLSYMAVTRLAGPVLDFFRRAWYRLSNYRGAPQAESPPDNDFIRDV